MQIKLWANFSKRYNSTKLPNDDDATIKNVSLKQPTDTEAPTFILEDTIASDWNYCQFLNNFYFINKIVIVNNNIIELQCAKDYLGTWKGFISQYNCFVDRSASFYDTMMNDEAISMNTNFTQASAVTELDIVDVDTGFYILRCISQNGYKTYVTTQSNVNRMFSMLLGDTQNSMTELVHNTWSWSNYIYKPQEHILSFKWVPFNLNTVLTRLGLDPSPLGPDYVAMWIGWASAYGMGWDVTGQTLAQAFEPNLPTQAYIDFRAYNNSWTQYGMYLPIIGQLSLDASIFNGNIIMKYAFDFDTCEMIFSLSQLSLDGNKIVATWKNIAGIDIPLASTSNGDNGLSTVLSLAGTALGIGTGTGIASVIASNDVTRGYGTGGTVGQGAIAGAQQIVGAYNSLIDTFSVTNGAGNKTTWKLYPNIIISRRSFDSGAIPLEVYGRPLKQNVTLGTLSGYIKCSNASIDIPSHGDDKQIVNSLLNSGFYFE